MRSPHYQHHCPAQHIADAPQGQIGGSRSCLTEAAKRRRSAGHVEYGICAQIAAIEDGDRVFRRKNYQLDFPKLGVPFHFGHHRQPALCSGANNQLAAAPRNVFLDRDGRVAVGIPIPLGSLFLPLSNLASVNDQVEVINSAVDLHRAERELLEVHRHHPQYKITPRLDAPAAEQVHTSTVAWARSPLQVRCFTYQGYRRSDLGRYAGASWPIDPARWRSFPS